LAVGSGEVEFSEVIVKQILMLSRTYRSVYLLADVPVLLPLSLPCPTLVLQKQEGWHKSQRYVEECGRGGGPRYGCGGRLDGSGDEFADVDFDAGTEGFAGGLQECSGDFGADVGFATVVADLRGDFADDQSSGVAFEGDGGEARMGFTEFADDAFHGFRISKTEGLYSGSGRKATERM
jgi:hypothetical protein